MHIWIDTKILQKLYLIGFFINFTSNIESINDLKNDLGDIEIDKIDFYLSSRRNTKSAYCFLGKILKNVKKWQIPHVINTDKAPTYGSALSRLKREEKCPPNLEHRQIK